MPNSGSAAMKRQRDVDRTHEPAPGKRFATDPVMTAREESMQFPYGRKFYLRRGGIDMEPIGPRKGTVPMIRLGEVPDVERILPTALRMLGPDHLVPVNPDHPRAQRTINDRPYSWGEMGGSRAVESKAAREQREAAEKAATKKAKKKAR